MRGCRKILIAVNGCKEPLYHGLKLASDEKTWVTVIKVVPPYEGDLDLTGIKNIGDVLASESKKAISEIDNIAEAERALIKARIEEGEAYRKIIEVAREERCDIIIMGAPRRSWFRRILGDNVVERVIKQAPCPVLVVTP